MLNLTTMILEILIVINLVFFAIWNGLVIKWGLCQDKSKVAKVSKYWHTVGFLIRALLVVIIFLTSGNWWWTGAAAFLCWLPYNMIINWCNGWPTFYFGKTSWIDRLINKLL